MGPIELLYFSIGAVFVLIALARGYDRELGVTVVALTAVFVLTYFQPQIQNLLTRVFEDFIGITDQETLDLIYSLTFTGLFVAAIFAGYAGRTLSEFFRGRPVPPPGGTLLSFLVGLANAYLIAGTLWYFQDYYQYPLQQVIPIEDWRLSQTAVTLTQYLPPRLLENPVYWIIPVIILLLMRIRG